MKKYLFITGFLAFSAAGMISCEKVVDIDVPFEQPKLVLKGFLNPDSSIAVHVSKSQFILDEAELKDITDAKVSVLEDGKLLGQLQHRENGNYFLEGVNPQPGKSYVIQAEKNGLPSVSAGHSVLPKIYPVNVKIENTSNDEYGGKNFKMEFEVPDPAAEKNYYLVKVFEKGEGWYLQWYGDKEGDTIRQPYSFLYDLESPDPVMETFCIDWNGCGLIASDEYFNGNSYRFKINARGYSPYPGTEEAAIYIILYHIPESLYLFYKTFENNRNVRDNPFAEPAKVFTNVEGGYGLWSSVSPSVIKIRL